MLATSYPHRWLLRELWAAWLADHPGAVPPPNLELYLRPLTGHAAQLAATARRKLRLTDRNETL